MKGNWCIISLYEHHACIHHTAYGICAERAIVSLCCFAKNRYTWSLWCQKQVILKQSTNHTPGALRLAKSTPYLFLAWKGQVHLVLSTFSSFQLFLANFEPFRGHTLVPLHPLHECHHLFRLLWSSWWALLPRHITTLSPHEDPPHRYTYI